MLPELAARRLRSIQANQPAASTESLLDYIPRVTPRWDSPTWLSSYTDVVEEALRRPIRIVVAAPPQHGKTETTVHGLTRAFRLKPGGRSAYATYNAKRAARVETKARLIAERDRLPLQFRQDIWFDPASEGALIWASRSGGLTGDPVDTLLVIDDILKDRQEANSQVTRQECIDWFDDVAEPRCHPTASIIVMATRWHPDDLSGVLVKRGWRYLNIKALADGPVDENGIVIGDPLRRRPGEPLCEARKTKASLEEKRKTNAYSFASLYQGEPRPREGTVFRDPAYYSELPSEGFRVGYGVDLAYSEKKQADWSVVIRMYAVTSDRDIDADGKPITRYYIADVVRHQIDAPAFLLTLKARHSEQRGPMLWLASGTEKGTAQFIQQRVPLKVKTASEDKYQRALPVSEAWNAGRVMVPKPRDADTGEGIDAAWLDEFLDEVLNFTGVKDAHDDQVDALAAGFEVLRHAPKDLTIGGIARPRRWQ